MTYEDLWWDIGWRCVKGPPPPIWGDWLFFAPIHMTDSPRASVALGHRYPWCSYTAGEGACLAHASSTGGEVWEGNVLRVQIQGTNTVVVFPVFLLFGREGSLSAPHPSASAASLGVTSTRSASESKMVHPFRHPLLNSLRAGTRKRRTIVARHYSRLRECFLTTARRERRGGERESQRLSAVVTFVLAFNT